MPTIYVSRRMDLSSLQGSRLEGLGTVLSHPGNTGVALSRMEQLCQTPKPLWRILVARDVTEP